MEAMTMPTTPSMMIVMKIAKPAMAALYAETTALTTMIVLNRPLHTQSAPAVAWSGP
jgi:hypothetical protein